MFQVSLAMSLQCKLETFHVCDTLVCFRISSRQCVMTAWVHVPCALKKQLLSMKMVSVNWLALLVDRYPDMPTAADVVNALDQQALASILRAYGEEKHAKKIASAIIQARSTYPISRTQQLASIVAGTLFKSLCCLRLTSSINMHCMYICIYI